MRYFKLFIDMDEILMNLSKKVTEIVNEEHNKSFKPEDNKSYWWQDFGNIPQSYFEDLLERKGVFYYGEPIPGAIESLEKLRELGFEIHIITKPVHSKTCYYEKVQWMKKYLPWINLDKNFHTTGNKGLMSKEDRILVDDNSINLNEFRVNNGVGITLDYGWNQDWQGHRCYNWGEIFDLILEMEGIKTTHPKGVDINKYREYMKREDI